MSTRERGKKHQKISSSPKKAMKGSKQHINFHRKKFPGYMPPAYDHKVNARHKRLSKHQYQRDMRKALDSMAVYDEYHGVDEETTLKGTSRKLMTIIEDISEKGRMNDNQYLEMMNLLLKIHKSEEESSIQSFSDFRALRATRAMNRVPNQDRVTSTTWSEEESGPARSIRSDVVEYSLREALAYSYYGQ